MNRWATLDRPLRELRNKHQAIEIHRHPIRLVVLVTQG
jgi:hypothetical protein